MEQGNFEEYKKKYENSLSNPTVPIEDTALGKEVKKYYDKRNGESDKQTTAPCRYSSSIKWWNEEVE